jgi:glucose-1-phosphate cytidylyltransferase
MKTVLLAGGVRDRIDGGDEPFERARLTNLARDGQLQACRHEGFRQPVDTVRDRDTLNELAENGTPLWFQFQPQTDADGPGHHLNLEMV